MASIQKWVNQLDNLDENDPSLLSKWDGSNDTWKPYMDNIRTSVFSSSTRTRVTAVSQDLTALVKNADLSMAQTSDIFNILTLTYPRYVDKASREAAQSLGAEIVKRDRKREDAGEGNYGVAEHVISWLYTEASRICTKGSQSSAAAANHFVLLNWTCAIYTTCLQYVTDFEKSVSWPKVVEALSLLLDAILDPSSPSKSSLQKSAIDHTRRAVRTYPPAIPALVTVLTGPGLTSARAPLLGLVIDVTLRLKNFTGPEILPDVKSQINSFYVNHIFMSRTAIPSHQSSALRDFVRVCVNEKDLNEVYVPAMEKALLRFPEVALHTCKDFFCGYNGTWTLDAFKKILTPMLNSSRSSIAQVRAASVALFKAVLTPSSGDDIKLHAVNELLAPPKASKSASPEHRVSLYNMLGYIHPSEITSGHISQNVPILLSKETNDAALNALCHSLAPHLLHLLANGQVLEPSIVSALMKDAASTKVASRRSVTALIGTILWGLQGLEMAGASEFSLAAIPSFESNLKAIASISPNSQSGIFEGYVSLATLLGPLSRWWPDKIEEIVHQHSIPFSFNSQGPKASFLVWDKVYQKLTESDDEQWFLRALEAVAQYPRLDFMAAQEARTLLGLAFCHCGVESRNVQIRRDCISVLSSLTRSRPAPMNAAVVSGLKAFISRSPAMHAVENIEASLKNRYQLRLILVLSTCASYQENTSSVVKTSMLHDTLLLGHHPQIGGGGRQCWVELIQKASIDPQSFISENAERLVEIVYPKTPDSKESSDLRLARFRAVTTLAFIAPESTLPLFVSKLQIDLDLGPSQSLSQQDLDIWRTPEGTLYIDILASKKPTAIQKGKDQDIQKWEAEIRKTLSSKKGVGERGLSKQDEALVKAQLIKEADTRLSVNVLRQRILDGVELTRSLIASQSEAFQAYLSLVGSLLLACALGRPADLAGVTIYDGYLSLSSCCNELFGSVSQWIGIATLRALGATVVPKSMQVESLEDLTLRVLYRCCTLAEQKAFDPASYSYINPLINAVIEKGGLEPSADETALEQLTLALNFIQFHTANVGNVLYPRIDMMNGLTKILSRHYQLAKESTSVLVQLGEGIQMNATRKETDFLIRSTLVEEAHARNAVLQSLQPFDLTELDWSPELWIACHDRDEQNARLARHIWDDNGLDIIEEFSTSLITYLDHDSSSVRMNTCHCFPESLESWPSSIGKLSTNLQELYCQRIPDTNPQYNEFGILIADPTILKDPWPTRLASAVALELIAPYCTQHEVLPFFDFLISKQALGDKHADVRRAMLQAGVAMVDVQGASYIPELMRLFEDLLNSNSTQTQTDDHIKEAIIVLFGRLAKHLDPGDTRLPTIIDRLVLALKTPSEQVQTAVSECLSPLVQGLSSTEDLVEKLFSELFNASRYAERRGAAYGVAGVIHGLGISSMKTYRVIDQLKQALEDKKQFEARQGAMFALETLASTLGRLFEPFITQILSLLLSAFGDAIPDVREATNDASKALMASISAYGVKLILPSLLSGLEEKQWRTKKGAIELLGAMAYCSPKQLSISLPTVIPRLTGVLTDSHAQVRAAANKSLKQFGEVISNPEIQGMVPILLKGLVDPDKIPASLSSLLKTSFMHYIDSPSLALVVPILERGLKQRGEPKRKSCQIVGNMASLTDPKDFVPYLVRLMPLVHLVLVDPVPEARATAAKAMGTLVERLGEIHFPDLVPGLLQTLKSDSSAIDRQGAAQGLSEVLSGLGMERLEGLLPDIISNSTSSRPFVREGFMSLLVYLPATFGSRFQPHLSKIVTPILSGLADDEQSVQDAAMKAGRMIITNYSNRAVDLLLPELEISLFDEGWRIRQSSLTLVGELLFKISGISGKTEVEDEEEAPVDTNAGEISRKVLTETLGKDRRDQLLSAFYILRQDAITFVRQSSIHIWKALVHNTPKTVREILPSLINKIVDLLANARSEQQATAERTIGELCRKFGERIVAEMIPLMREGAKSPDSRTRAGICLALSDIMENTTDPQREGHENEIVAIVRASLVDHAPDVRAAAAKAFDVLQTHMGARAIDQTIPTLLEALRQSDESSSTALQALKEVMNVRAGTVFPVLIPTLLSTPTTAFNLRALGSLVTVAGTALSKRVSVIITALVKILETERNDELVIEANACVEAVLGSVEDMEGLNTLMLLLLGWSKHEHATRRTSAIKLFGVFCRVTDSDFSIYRVDWIRQLIPMFDDPHSDVYSVAPATFDAFIKSIPKDEYEGLVIPIHRSIESTGSIGRTVPGFSIPNAVAPFVPVLIAGLTTGSSEQREHSAYAMSDLITRTEEMAIKPFVVPFTGPLIRVATQAMNYPPGVKVAILSALEKEVTTIPGFIKPFFPQLQRTFAKAVGDPASITVRTKAADALGALMKHVPRVDQVCTELITGVKANLEIEEAIAASFVYALAMIVKSASAALGEEIKKSILELLRESFNKEHQDAYIDAISLLFAMMAPFGSLLQPLVETHLVAGTRPSQLSSATILGILEHSTSLFQELAVGSSVAKKIMASIGSERPSTARPAREARELMRNCGAWDNDQEVLDVLL